jgi:ABC1 atypical kinase-like domain
MTRCSGSSMQMLTSFLQSLRSTAQLLPRWLRWCQLSFSTCLNFGNMAAPYEGAHHMPYTWHSTQHSAVWPLMGTMQVHKARLLTGEAVAVKVQYAGLESAVAADLATFSGLATLAGAAFPDFKLGWVSVADSNSASDYVISTSINLKHVHDQLAGCGRPSQAAGGRARLSP